MFKKKCANCGHPSKFHKGSDQFYKLWRESSKMTDEEIQRIFGFDPLQDTGKEMCNVDIIDYFGAHNGVPYGKAYRCTCTKFQNGD